MQDLELSCRCGQVRGRASKVSSKSVNRVICYCADCQAFLHHLGRPELMDSHGGTDIVQVAPPTVRFDVGSDRIAGVRLSPKGLFRWHSTCCNTPLGNTMAPWLPFIGIGPEAWTTAGGSQWQSEEMRARRTEVFGPISTAAFTQFATSPPSLPFDRSPARGMASALCKMASWKLRGQTWPHPFFERETQAPRFAMEVLSAQTRESLRSLCGPQSSTHGHA